MSKLTTFLAIILITINTISAQTSWIGGTNTKWKTSSNWTAGVPDQNTDAIIGDANFTGPNQPKLNGSTARCLSLTIGNGAIASTLSIEKNIVVYGDLLIGANGTVNANKNNRSITVKGNWTNNGSYSPTTTSARVTFSGTNQTITGATTFERVQVNSSSILSLASNITIDNELKLYGELHPISASTVSGTGDLVVKNYGDLYVYSENFTDNYPISGSITLDKYSYVNYAAPSITQYISSAFSYGRLRISGGSTKELTANLPDLQSSNSSTGRVYIDAGTLDLKTFTADRGSSSTGGYFIIYAGSTLKIGGTNGFPSNYSYMSLNSTSTVEYYGDNQTVIDLNYGNLTFSGTSGSVVKTMPNTSMYVYGDFIATIGTATDLSFTAMSHIYFKKDITLGTSTTFNGSSYTHTFYGDWINNGTYTSSTSYCYFRGAGANLSGTGTNNFYALKIRAANITAEGNTPITVTNNISAQSGGFTHKDGGTCTIDGTNSIIWSGNINFYDLNIDDVTTSYYPFIVRGDLTVDGSFVGSSSNSISLNGTSKTVSGTGFISFYRLFVNGTITTARDFTIKRDLFVSTAGSFTATNGLATFDYYTTLTGRADLYDLTINSGKTLRLGVNSVLGIANVFTRIGNLSMTSTSPNLVEYNGAGNQDVIAESYYNLTMANASTKTALGNITCRNNFTIDSGVDFDASSTTMSIYRDWINNGTFTSSTSDVQFRSTIISNIYGTNAFNTFTVNKSSSSTLTYLKNNTTANNAVITKGLVNTESNSLTTYGGRSGNGIIHGTIIHSHAFTSGTSYYFEGPKNYIKFTTPSAGLTSVSVKVTPDEVADFDPNVESIEREYEITIPAGTYTDATLRFHYEDNELSAFEEPFLAIYKHNTGIIWDSIGYTSRSTADNWVEHTALTAITGRFTFSGQRKVVEWNGSVSDEWEDSDNWTTISGSDMSNRVPTSDDAVKIGVSTFTNQPKVYDSQDIAALRLGATKAVTLTLDNTFSTVNSIKGIWPSSTTHTIDIGSNQLDVGSNIHLGNGAAGNIINITASSGDINVDNNLLHKSSSSISFSGSGNITINGNYNYTSGSFTPATSTVTYSGPISQIVAPFTYYNLAFTKTNERALINSATTVNGNLETSIGGEVELQATLTTVGNITIGEFTTFVENNADIYLAGNWVNNGTFTANTGEVNFNGTSAQSVNLTTFNDVEIDKSSGTLTLADSIIINNDFIITNGTVDLNTYKADRSVNGGTFSLAASSTLLVGGTDNFPNYYSTTTIDSLSSVVYDGTSTQNILDGISYGNLTFSNGTTNAKTVLGNITVKNNLLINSGATLGLDSINVSLYGNITNSGTINPGESTLILDGSSKTVTGPLTLNNLTVNGSYDVLSGTTNMTGDFYIETTGDIDFGNNNASLDGDLTHKGVLVSNGTATFTGTREQSIQLISAITSASTGIINLNGTVAPVLNSTSSPSFATININNTAGITASSPWNVYVAMNIAAGASFNDGGLTHTIYKDFTNNGDVVNSGLLKFIPGAPFSASGTVTLDGTSFTSTGDVEFGGTAELTIIDNNPTFNNVIVSNTYSSGVSAPDSWDIVNLQVLNGATFNAGTANSHTVSNSILNNGTINGETSLITFTGTGNEINGVGTCNLYDLTIQTGADLTLNKSIEVNHNLTNDGTFSGLGRTVTFTGSLPSIVNGSTGSITFGDLELDKTSTTTTLQIPSTVTDGLYLTDGILISDATNLLILNDDATSTPGNATSFVDGPMKKIGDDAFIFPIGNGAKWARLGISAPSVTTDAFTAQYSDNSYTNTTTMAGSPAPVLNNVSINEYWTCDRTTGSSNVTVQLFWENAVTSGITGYTSDLVVAHWNGSGWENAGQSAIAGTNPGSITSNTVSSFSPFTFGSLSAGLNPLPIELIEFTANLKNEIVNLTWETNTEINNDFFTVERSADGVNFEEHSIVKGAGNSANVLQYKTTDLTPLAGTSYYRLKQTDFDGKSSYSSIEMVTNEDLNADFNLFPNPNKGDLINISLKGLENILEVTISDVNSRAIFSEKTNSNQLAIKPSKRLESGVYIVTIITNNSRLNRKLIVN